MSSIIYPALLLLGSTLPEQHKEKDCFFYFADGKVAKEARRSSWSCSEKEAGFLCVNQDKWASCTVLPTSAWIEMGRNAADCSPFFYFQVIPVTYPEFRLLDQILKRSFIFLRIVLKNTQGLPEGLTISGVGRHVSWSFSAKGLYNSLVFQLSKPFSRSTV